MDAGRGLVLLVLVALTGPAAMERDAMDASWVTWTHAVNSAAELEDALAGTADFLEADVVMGHLGGHRMGPPIPVMSHAPKEDSDISLERWIDTMIARGDGKGVKLDFKQLEAVEPSLQLLQKHGRKIDFPLWLNTDILAGPVAATRLPVSASDFLKLCGRHFPNATLSLGWTTYYSPLFPADTLRYSWKDVRDMADIVRCQELVDQHVTFAVRAAFVGRSIPLLRWLLSEFEQSTLTVWSIKGDPLGLSDLLKIRESFEASRVYYDVPEPLSTTFRALKDGHKFNASQTSAPSYKWTSFDRSSGTIACASHTYVNNDTVVFGRQVSSGVLLSDVYQLLEGNRLQVQGAVTFFDPDISDLPRGDSKHTLSLVLVDVSSFSKNRSGIPEGDNNLIWDAMNRSVLHEFKCDFHKSSTSCRYFRLDSASEEGFQAWEVPCEALLDEGSVDEVLKDVGQREKTRGLKLVLPAADVMFGMISRGPGHVAVHQIDVKGTTSPKSPVHDINNAPAFKSTAVLSILIVLSLFVFLV